MKIKRLLCKLFKHRWENLNTSTALPYLVCERCGEKWLVKTYTPKGR